MIFEYGELTGCLLGFGALHSVARVRTRVPNLDPRVEYQKMRLEYEYFEYILEYLEYIIYIKY